MSISFSGLASGLDTSSWVKSLTALKQAKVTSLQEERENVVLSKDTLASIKSFFTSFRSMLERVTDTRFNIPALDLFAQNIATSAKLDVLTASATTDAVGGTYKVKVDKLASNTNAVSKFTYVTTIIETTTAVEDSKLINMGATAGNIAVRVNGVEHGITITEDDTLATFTQKLKDIGVTANYNSNTGVFTVDLSRDDIIDLDTTNIADALHLEGVNEGYTSNQLQIKNEETVWNAAEGTTFLSELGVSNGTVVVNANNASYTYNIDDTTTLQSFINSLNANNINASLSADGIFTLEDAVIDEVNSTSNLKTAFGLSEEVNSNSQSSNGLIYSTTIAETTTATLSTKLNELGDGITITGTQDVIVKNSNDELVTINVTETSSLGDLLTGMNNAGLSAELNNDGTIEISGGTIVGGSFDAVDALGLNSTPYTAWVSGNALTETVEVFEMVTLETRLVDDLGVKEGYLQVTDSEGDSQFLKVYSGQTISDLMSDLANMGIYSSLDEETGVLSITGGDFTTLTDADVNAFIASGAIQEPDARYQQGTDLIESLYGAPAISLNQTQVSQTYARSRALTYETLVTVNATGTTTLETLGMNPGASTAVFDVRGENRTINVDSSMTIDDLITTLQNNGISAEFNEETGKITIDNAILTSPADAGTLGGVLNLTTEITGKYTNSDALYAARTIAVSATGATTFDELGVTTTQDVLLYNNAGVAATITIDGTTSIDSLVNSINSAGAGVTAAFNNGVLELQGGYIANTAVETALGLERDVDGISHALGNSLTITTTAIVDAETTLGDVITTMGTTSAVSGGYNLSFNSHALTVDANTKLVDLMDQITDLGGSCYLDATGRLAIDGGTLTGSVATALGFESVTTTNSVSATGETMAVISTVFADTTTKLSEMGYGSSVISIKGDDGVELGTITTNADMTIGDMFTAMSAYGVSGTITDGVISLDSNTGAYATGGVLDSMGIGTSEGTYTTTAGVTNTSSSVLSCTTSYNAVGTTTLGQLGYGDSTVTIKGVDGTEIGTIATNADMTMDGLMAALAGYGISATLDDGVLSLDSDTGAYATGGVIASMGVTTTESNYTTTAGTAVSSSGVVTFSTVTYSTSYPTLTRTITTTSTVVTTQAIVGTETIMVTDTIVTTEPVIGTQTITVTQTVVNTQLVTESKTIMVTDTIVTTTPIIGTQNITITNLVVSTQIVTNTKTITVTDTIVTTEPVVGTENIVIKHTIITNEPVIGYKTITISDTFTVGNAVAGTTVLTLSKTLDITQNVTMKKTITVTGSTVIQTTTTSIRTITTGGSTSITEDTTLAELGQSGQNVIIFGITKPEIDHTIVHNKTVITEETDTLGQLIDKLNAQTDQNLCGSWILDTTNGMIYSTNGQDGNYMDCVIDISSNSYMQFGQRRLDTADGYYGEIRLNSLDLTYVTSLPSSTSMVSPTQYGYVTLQAIVINGSGNQTSVSVTFTPQSTSWAQLSGLLNYEIDNALRNQTGSGANGMLFYYNESTGEFKLQNENVTAGSSSFRIALTTPSGSSASPIDGATWVYGSGGSSYIGFRASPEVTTIANSSTSYQTVTIPASQTITTTGSTVVTMNTTVVTQTVVSQNFTVDTASVEDEVITVSATFTVENTTTKPVTHVAETTITVEKTGTTTKTHTIIGTFTVTDTRTNVTTQQVVTTTAVEKTTTGLQTHTVSHTFTVTDTRTEVTTQNVVTTTVVEKTSTTLKTHEVSHTFTVENTRTVPVTHTVIGTAVVETTTYQITSTTSTATMVGNTKLGQLGITSGSVTLVSDGKEYVLSFGEANTVNDFLTALSGYGIGAEIKDGKIKLTGDEEAYIKSMTGLDALKVTVGSGVSYNTTTHTITANTDSNAQGYSTTLTMTTDTKLSDLGMTASGTFNVYSDGESYIVQIEAGDTVGDIISSLAGLGIHATVDGGKLSITGDDEAYVTSISANLKSALALSDTNYTTTSHTATVNTDSNAQYRTITVEATGTTSLADLRNEAGAGMTFTGDNVSLVLSTTSDAGNQLVTLTFSKTASLHDVIDKLAEYGINAQIDSAGRFSVSSSSLTDFDFSGELGTFLMGTYTKHHGEGSTKSVSDNLIHSVVVDMHDGLKLSQLGITSGNILVSVNGTVSTLALDANQTMAEFRNQLANFGITSEIVAGKLSLNADGVVYLETPTTGGSNAIDVLGVGYDRWILGGFSQESDMLGDTQTIVEVATMGRTLAELTDSTGTPLGITNGQIYAYQNGTRNLINIDTNETLSSLAAKLSQYGITINMTSDGVLYFNGDNNSYLTTEGIDSANASNILTKLNIADEWKTRYTSTSQKLEYGVTEDKVIDENTRLVDLQDADGNSLNITTGEYVVYSNGVRTSETITDDTTVGDLMATMAGYSMSSQIASDGSITFGAQNNSYMATAVSGGDDTNLISTLFAEWNFVNVYTSNNIEIPEDVTVAVTRTTKLADINEGAYEDGLITVVHDGVQTNISLTADDTVGTLIDTLAVYGFDCVLNDSGQLMVMNSGNSVLQNYAGADKASNVLDIMNIGVANWTQTNLYTAEPVDVNTYNTTTAAATRDTLLSDLGITTGEYNIYNNGVKYTALISSDETLGSLMNTLQTFGIESNIIVGPDSTKLEITGNGETYVARSASTTNASNIADVLFPTANAGTEYDYSALLQTSTVVTSWTNATDDTLLSELDVAWGNDVLKAAGQLSVTVDGVTSAINITADETFGSLKEKFRAVGLEASISNGVLMVQSGYKEFTINQDTTTSSMLANFGLTFSDDLGGYCASNTVCEATTTLIEERTASVANYADDNTVMGLLNISSGTLSVFKNGERATIEINSDETFLQLRSRIATALGDVDIKFENGYLTFYSTAGDSVEVGSTTDTSNFAAICGLSNNKTGTVQSSRELYKVNGDSKVVTSGLFKLGDVTEGTFTIGDAVFTIDANTSLQNIISQINASEAANATASWDSVDGKLVIKSRTTGSSFINIEAGTSNFTDIMGYTSTERDAGGDVVKTRINVNAQDVGDNAQFSINGTQFSSTSNTITSDLSRIQGVTINLKGISDGETVELKVERDKESVANAVEDIVSAYNDLIENVDKEIAKGAQLDDQFTLKLLRNQIRTLMTSSLMGSGVYKNLDAVGISLNAATAGDIRTDNINILSFDKDKFMQAFDSDRNALKELLVGTETSLGIFSKVESVVEQAVGTASGYFSSAERSYNNQISRLDQKIDKAQTAVERYRARLENKFQAMDMLIANMQNQYSSFLV